jgi:hypothetical protein
VIPNIVIGGACERDLDLLLMEELTASSEFARWFINLLGIDHDTTLVEVAHSVTTSNGESDLELTVNTRDGLLKVLIEDKVDAQFQPRQAARYRERAATYIKTGVCRLAKTVLVAPETYIKNTNDKRGFDQHVSLEELASWFRRTRDLEARTAFKCALLERTIERSASGWERIADDQCTAFWRDYWEQAERIAPELNMPYPDDEKPAGSTFIPFRPKGLPKNVSMYHKLAYGTVDLQFAGMGDDIATLRTKYRNALEPGMIIQQAGKSAVIRLRVPPLDVALPLRDSLPAVEQGLNAAARLLTWFRQHEAE